MNWDGIISLLFFCIELILLLNVIYFGRKRKSLYGGMIVISLLAGYQLMEYLICGIGLRFPFTAFLAFAVISYLPPVNLLFIMSLLKKRTRWDRLAFLPVTAILLYYFTVIEEFNVEKCSVLYAVYSYPLGDLYGLIYYLPLIISIVLLFSSLKSKLPLQKRNISVLLAGNLFISLPVVTAFILHFAGNPDLLSMVESIMCKFAIVLAFIYAYVIIYLSRENSVE